MADTPKESNLTSSLKENRRFAPSAEFARQAVVDVGAERAQRELGASDPETYWADAARELDWFKPWDRVLEWDAPRAKWFVGGTLNVAHNCLDRHLPTQAAKRALVWEGEPGEVVTWTYAQLHDQVERMTAGLRRLGLQPGDRVAIYLPMVPEAVVTMLACARGGFTHTVVFGGFSAEALKDRIQDAQARVLVTADGGYRKGGWLKLKEQAELAVAQCPTVEHVVMVERAHAGEIFRSVAATPLSAAQAKVSVAQPVSYRALLEAVSSADQARLGAAAELDAEHPLFILYTSGTTGKPKGIVHSTGGYLTGVLRTTKTVFDLKPEDLYWCTADIGWVTGHSYLVYGPLAAGASILIYEGAPTHPAPDRLWKIVERHRATIFYTAPTAIRALMRLGPEHPKSADLSSLRLLGTVGEPINPEAWMWYRENVGGGRCPIVDTYWQTETGAIVISPLPGVTATTPGSATTPLPGYDVDVVDKAGHAVPVNTGGYLVIRKPWPSMARTIYGDAERFKKQYFSEFANGVYFTGDGARKDEHGYIWCLGRVDDVLNVSGHRLGTMEIESALVSHPWVAEAAVVGRPDDLKGQAVVAFVTLKASENQRIGKDAASIKDAGDVIKAHVAKEIGSLARPDDLRFTDSLPKTRSGKIMRRLLRELATNGKVQGDTTTLEDWTVIQSLQTNDEE
jgi:acetyl-CoA synthetase